MQRSAAIVVGLDESAASAAALRWAAVQSRATSTLLLVVHAYTADLELRDRREVSPVYRSLMRTKATRWLRDALAGSTQPWRARLVVALGAPVDVLARAAGGAGLLVLGAPRRTVPAETAGATVVRGCRARVGCPVMVVPGPEPAVPFLPGQRRRAVRDAGSRARP